MGIPVLVNYIFLHVKAQVFQGREGHTLIVLISNVFNCYCHNYTLLYTSIQILPYSYQLSCWEGIEDQG